MYMVLYGYNRYMVSWDLREQKTEKEKEIECKEVGK